MNLRLFLSVIGLACCATATYPQLFPGKIAAPVSVPTLIPDYDSHFHTHSVSVCPILPGSLPGFSRMQCTEKELERFGDYEEACLTAKYGIDATGLLARNEVRQQSLLSYNKPVMNASWLHKEKVVGDIQKKLRREQWDFSGIIQDVLMMPPGFGGP